LLPAEFQISFRQRYRGGKIVDYGKSIAEFIAKHGPKMEKLWKQFYDGIAIKVSNEIRQGLGKWKNLTQSQRIVQHDNFTKVVDGMIKNKKYDPKIDEYAGINAQKEFIEANTKLIESKGVKEVSKARTMDDLVEDAYKEIKGGSGFSGDYKYDADILASEIALKGGRIFDDMAPMEQSGIYDLAYKRVIIDLKAKMDFKKNLKDVEQKIELQMFDPKDKKPNAEGGLIGYATGGVSNLFRSR